MTVVNPKSISGINSITTGSGSDNLLTIHTNDGTERVRVDNTGATKIVTGIVTTLTATTGIVTSLEATTGDITTLRAPTGIVTSLEATTGDITTLRAPTGIVTTFVTNTAKVGAAVTITESGIEASGIGITCANINGTQIGGRRNIIINGDMKIAQRTTTAQNAPISGPQYKTIDRWLTWANAADKFSTQQVAEAPSGFKYSLKVTSLGANANESYQTIGQRFESQDLAQLNLGTAYAKPFTISFWVKSSLTGTFTGYLHGASSFTPSLVWTYTITDANTWEHKKVNIPAATITDGGFGSGGAELGMEMGFTLSGYGYKTANANTWVNEVYKLAVTGLSSVDVTATNGATFYVTGVQLEAGTQGTPFEHRTFAEELLLCQRYFQVLGGSNGTYDSMSTGSCSSSTVAYVPHRLTHTMRSTPSFTLVGSASDFRYTKGGDQTPSGITLDQAGKNMVAVRVSAASDHLGTDDAIRLFNINTTGAFQFSAEI